MKYDCNDLRKDIIQSVVAIPRLGVNYIDCQTDDGKSIAYLNLGTYGGVFKVTIEREMIDVFDPIA